MYSPKIREDLVPALYRIAKAQRRPMTRLVNQLIENGLAQLDRERTHDSATPLEQPQRPRSHERMER